MECKFHPYEETIDNCVLCNTPLCVKCLADCKDVDYGLVCLKCLKALGLVGDRGF